MVIFHVLLKRSFILSVTFCAPKYIVYYKKSSECFCISLHHVKYTTFYWKELYFIWIMNKSTYIHRETNGIYVFSKISQEYSNSSFSNDIANFSLCGLFSTQNFKLKIRAFFLLQTLSRSPLH